VAKRKRSRTGNVERELSKLNNKLITLILADWDSMQKTSSRLDVCAANDVRWTRWRLFMCTTGQRKAKPKLEIIVCAGVLEIHFNPLFGRSRCPFSTPAEPQKPESFVSNHTHISHPFFHTHTYTRSESPTHTHTPHSLPFCGQDNALGEINVRQLLFRYPKLPRTKIAAPS